MLRMFRCVLLLIRAGLVFIAGTCTTEQPDGPRGLVQFCRGKAKKPWRARVSQGEFCHSEGWVHSYNFWAFDSEQPGTKKYCVGTAGGSKASGPYRYWVADRSSCTSGDGFHHQFNFWAYEEKVPGTRAYCIGWKSSDGWWRIKLNRASNCEKHTGWTHSFTLYMFEDDSDMPTLRSQVLRSITYPTLDALPPVSPTTISTDTFCNEASFPQEFGGGTLTRQVTTSTVSCFEWDISTTGGFSVTTGLTVSGGMLGLWDAELFASGTVHWSASAGVRSDNCRESTAEETQVDELSKISVPPKTALVFTETRHEGEANGVPFKAVVDQYWSDGSETSTPITGTYKGAFYSRVHRSIHDVRAVDSCSRRLDDHNDTMSAYVDQIGMI